ncbi:MAG TPA: hypothetical protein VGO59_09120 [Verrucomicrobiae bacterium]|jgi:hypothetical protein
MSNNENMKNESEIGSSPLSRTNFTREADKFLISHSGQGSAKSQIQSTHYPNSSRLATPNPQDYHSSSFDEHAHENRARFRRKPGDLN